MFIHIPHPICRMIRYGQITTTDAFILAMVLGFDNSKQETCNVPNKYFATHLNMRIGSVKNIIAKLKKQGLLEVHLVGNFRTLKVTLQSPMLNERSC
jgi:hypothetical protein